MQVDVIAFENDAIMASMHFKCLFFGK